MNNTVITGNAYPSTSAYLPIGTISTSNYTVSTGTDPYYTTNTITTAPKSIQSIQFTVNPNNLTVSLDAFNNYFKIKDPNTFTSITQIVPERVYKFQFADKTIIKTIRDESDPFDFEYMFYLAIAKKLFSQKYTFEGVLAKSYQLQYEKYYNKLVKQGIRLYKKLEKEKLKREEQEKIKKRQHQKYVAKKKAAKERKRKDQINIIAEAIRLSKEEG